MHDRIKIDETDARILKMLLQDSRTSFTEIAKKCKISVGAVRMRYKELWKSGVINGEILQVNPHSLGYTCICNIGAITAIDDEREVIEFLQSKPYVSRVLRTFGKYNCGVIVALPNIEKLSEVIADLEVNPRVKHVDVFIWAESVGLDHPENLVIQHFTEKTAHEHSPISLEVVPIDETDRQIAKMLVHNSRMPFRKVAEKLKISSKSVIQRYRRLRKSVLTFSTIAVDLKKLGYNAMAHIFIKVSNRSAMPEIYAQILQIPNLIVAIKCIGPYDLYVIVVLASFEELFKVNEYIRRIQKIEQADISLRPSFASWPLNMFTTLL